MSTVLKLMMNSLYGKMIQKLSEENLVIYNDMDKFDKDFSDGKLGDILDLVGEYKPGEFNDGYILFASNRIDPETATPKELDRLINRCPHLGAFILSRSKQIMNYAFDAIDGFTDPEQTPYYSDTDSMQIMHSSFLKMKYLDPDKHGYESDGSLKLRMNPWGFPWVNRDPNAKNFLTQFHDDTDDAAIDPKIIYANFVALKVKSLGYACYEDKFHQEHYENDRFRKHSVGTFEKSVPISKKLIKGPATRSLLYKDNTKYKGFKAHDDKNFDNAIGFGAKITAIDDEPVNGGKKYKLNGDLLDLMLPDDPHSIEICYKVFKRNTQEGRGIETQIVNKKLNTVLWGGRYYCGGRWYPWGSNMVPEDANKAKLEEIRGKKPKSNVSY